MIVPSIGLLITSGLLLTSTVQSRRLVAEHQALQQQRLEAFLTDNRCQAIHVPGTSYTVYHCPSLGPDTKL